MAYLLHLLYVADCTALDCYLVRGLEPSYLCSWLSLVAPSSVGICLCITVAVQRLTSEVAGGQPLDAGQNIHLDVLFLVVGTVLIAIRC